MKFFTAIICVLLLAVGCIKPPEELVQSFWDQETEVTGLGFVIDTSTYQINQDNERFYEIKFGVNWANIPLVREFSILSVTLTSNGRNQTIQYPQANRSEYYSRILMRPGETNCLAFKFFTSTGGFTRTFDLACITVP
jgi:hypothetical protein